MNQKKGHRPGGLEYRIGGLLRQCLLPILTWSVVQNVIDGFSRPQEICNTHIFPRILKPLKVYAPVSWLIHKGVFIYEAIQTHYLAHWNYLTCFTA